MQFTRATSGMHAHMHCGRCRVCLYTHTHTYFHTKQTTAATVWHAFVISDPFRMRADADERTSLLFNVVVVLAQHIKSCSVRREASGPAGGLALCARASMLLLQDAFLRRIPPPIPGAYSCRVIYGIPGRARGNGNIITHADADSGEKYETICSFRKKRH